MNEQVKTKLLKVYKEELKIQKIKEKAYNDDGINPHTKNIRTINNIINKLETL